MGRAASGRLCAVCSSLSSSCLLGCLLLLPGNGLKAPSTGFKNPSSCAYHSIAPLDMEMCSSIRKGQRFLGLGERRAESVSRHLDLLRFSPLPTTFPYLPHNCTLRAPSTCDPFLPSLAPPHSIPPNQLSHLPCHQHFQSQYPT